jgi:predicted AAA+ superfamily ATPase
MVYPRGMRATLENLARYFPAVVVSGARQSGKTFLVRQTFPHHHYVSLDLPSVAEQAERNPSDFLHDHPAPVVVDEVQYAPGLFRHLKAEIDRNRHAMGRYVLTGSQQFVLMKGVSESLAGRCGIVDLENLSRDEIAAGGPLPDTRGALVSLIARGQFPELWRLRDLPRQDFYAAYVATYLERDVRQILNVTSLRDFERFVRVLAARSGNLLNKSDVARDVGVSVKAIGDWLSVLQASGQIILLEPWYVNFGKRIVKTPKAYFRDSGLLTFLLNLDEDTLPTSPYMGAVWETFVFSEMRKLAALEPKRVGFWYYRDQRAREIDFILDRGGRLSFVECKWQEHPGIDDARALLAVSSELAASGSKWRPGRNWMIGTPAASYQIGEGLTAAAVRDLPHVLAG